MTDHYEMPHPDADACAHAGVGKACRPCREVLDNLHRISLRDTPAGRELMAEGWDALIESMSASGEFHDVDLRTMQRLNPYRDGAGHE